MNYALCERITNAISAVAIKVERSKLLPFRWQILSLVWRIENRFTTWWVWSMPQDLFEAEQARRADLRADGGWDDYAQWLLDQREYEDGISEQEAWLASFTETPTTPKGNI
jgi:hypothetical protein